MTLDLLDQRNDFFFLARITGKTVGLATVGIDGVDQRLQFIGAAPGDAGDKSFLGKTFGNGPASGVASTDNQHDFVVMGCCGHSHRSLVNGR